MRQELQPYLVRQVATGVDRYKLPDGRVLSVADLYRYALSYRYEIALRTSEGWEPIHRTYTLDGAEQFVVDELHKALGLPGRSLSKPQEPHYSLRNPRRLNIKS